MAGLVALLTTPAWSQQGSQNFNCSPNIVQSFPVPGG
jgi:hypothetical protein